MAAMFVCAALGALQSQSILRLFLKPALGFGYRGRGEILFQLRLLRRTHSLCKESIDWKGCLTRFDSGFRFLVRLKNANEL
ncbi:hypothetical protein X975_13594, partial [Stegodyphus mimosarum]